MKCTIFLLALSVFQTVFADLKEDLNNLREKSMSEMKGIIQKLATDVKAAVIYAKYRGAHSDVVRCWDEFKKLVKYHRSARRTRTYEDCYTRPFGIYYTEAFQFAEDCYAKSIKSLVAEEKKCRFNTKECIRKNFFVQFGPRRAALEPIPL